MRGQVRISSRRCRQSVSPLTGGTSNTVVKHRLDRFSRAVCVNAAAGREFRHGLFRGATCCYLRPRRGHLPPRPSSLASRSELFRLLEHSSRARSLDFCPRLKRKKYLLVLFVAPRVSIARFEGLFDRLRV